jgi:ribulose-phosphate 3-epimerase
MAQLVPSILETTKEGFLNIYRQETKLPGVERIQVDFGDGIFVPNKILPVEEMDVLNPAFHWEAHLMIKEPRDFLDYKICGFKTVIIHYEAFKNQEEILSAIKEIKSQGMEPALCVNPDTEISALGRFADVVRHFQIMGVYPGYQGTPFVEKTYGRVAELRSLMPNAIIEVDGGVSSGNIKQLISAGADLLILGSAITKVPNMAEAWEKLNAEVN